MTGVRYVAVSSWLRVCTWAPQKSQKLEEASIAAPQLEQIIDLSLSKGLADS